MKIGILGGTFNPIHYGHLTMAEFVLKNFGLDKICFLPNGQPPHKANDFIADKHHRLNMTKLAIDSYDDFYLSDYEVCDDKYHYTIDTIKHFKALNPDDEFFFIIGADSLFNLSSWKNAEELKLICSFIVCDRTGSGNTDAEINRLIAEGCRIQKADMPFVDIESTAIRNSVKQGKDISQLTPLVVYDYILKNNLYK